MSAKIYLHHEEPPRPEKTTKITVPAKWMTGKQVADVIELFAKSYNSQYSDHPIVTSEFHLTDSEGNKIFSDAVCGEVLSDRVDYYIKQGVHVKPSSAKSEGDSRLRCKNYGCGQYFVEEENHDEACTNHAGAPVFHDTLKYWSCCPEKKCFEFEAFQQVPGCARGRHSTVNKSVISASPNASTAPPVTVLKSISDFNAVNPEASTSAKAAVKIMTERKSSRSEDGITAKCQRKGCQKTFVLAENNSEACVHHKGQAVFHDAAKYWSCCPERKCYDFDDFLAVPGCAVGRHDDGVDDLEEEKA